VKEDEMDRVWGFAAVLRGIAQRRRQIAGFFTGVLFLAFLTNSFSYVSPALAQGGQQQTPSPGGGGDEPSQAPDRVEIEPTARDEEIRDRLKSILDATGWFVDPNVEVREGVVFFTGQAKSADYRRWAGDLGRSTQDVVAVVNQMELTEPSIWDVQPALDELRELWTNVIRSTPLIGFSLVVLLVTWLFTQFAVKTSRASLRKRLANPLLNNVVGYSIGVATFLIGLYVVLQVAGLTNVAMTVVGGTGLLGLILGIAFRDITENFLASIFLSVQNPFRTGDLVEIAGIQGFVQALTTRVTILMTLDGNHVQIPNATVYKSNIFNFSSNPRRRADFTIGIGYNDSITEAQEVALNLLQEHPAVLKDPEPLVLVESLGSSTVNLRMFFWIDGSQHDWVKVKSSIIRLTKRAFQQAGISMPDEAREMVFPQGVPVRMVDAGSTEKTRFAAPEPAKPKEPSESGQVSTQAEAGLASDASKIQEQARDAWKPEDGENLLNAPEKEQE
jgi:small-conductance mechanosensitive channel